MSITRLYITSDTNGDILIWLYTEKRPYFFNYGIFCLSDCDGNKLIIVSLYPTCNFSHIREIRFTKDRTSFYIKVNIYQIIKNWNLEHVSFGRYRAKTKSGFGNLLPVSLLLWSAFFRLCTVCRPCVKNEDYILVFRIIWTKYKVLQMCFIMPGAF